MATPVLAELQALVGDLERAPAPRCGGRRGRGARGDRVESADRSLKRVKDLVELAAQGFNLVSGRLGAALAKNA